MGEDKQYVKGCESQPAKLVLNPLTYSILRFHQLGSSAPENNFTFHRFN